MISRSKYEEIQRCYYNHINRTTFKTFCTINYISLNHSNNLESFFADGDRAIAEKDGVSQTFNIQCLYNRNITEKQREKEGIDQEVDTVLYISPLELELKTGSIDFPDYVRKSYSQITIQAFELVYKVTNIYEMEPLEVHGGRMCIAYRIDLTTRD